MKFVHGIVLSQKVEHKRAKKALHIFRNRKKSLGKSQRISSKIIHCQYITSIYLCERNQNERRMFLAGQSDIIKDMEGHTENLSMVVLPQSAWESLQTEVKSVKNILLAKAEENVKNQWVESTEARKRLGVSAKTWQTYRDQRRIPFSQFGRKIYVKQADLEHFMEQHYITK